MVSRNDSNSAPGHAAGGAPFGQGRNKDGQSRSAHTHSAEKAESDILRRVPPHSVEAEQAVLGGVFIRPQLMHSIADQLTDEDFYLPAHTTIYRAFLELYRKSAPLDLIATEAELIRTGHNGPRPGGVDWDRVQPDQYETIPFLGELKARMLKRRQGG